jgi:hypothetical protein
MVSILNSRTQTDLQSLPAPSRSKVLSSLTHMEKSEDLPVSLLPEHEDSAEAKWINEGIEIEYIQWVYGY